jgi:hypothetical protein
MHFVTPTSSGYREQQCKKLFRSTCHQSRQDPERLAAQSGNRSWRKADPVFGFPLTGWIDQRGEDPWSTVAPAWKDGVS